MQHTILLGLAVLAFYLSSATAIPAGPTQGKGKGKQSATFQASSSSVHAVQQIFDIDFGGTQAGTCKPYENKIKTAFEEVIQMLSVAEDAVRWLGQATLVKDDSQKGRGEKKSSSKIGQAYKALLGGSAVGADGRLTSNARTVLNTYSSLKAHHNADPISGPKFHLRCNDDFQVRLKSSDKDPRDRGTRDECKFTVGSPKRPRTACPHGAVWYQNLPVAYNYHCMPSDTDAHEKPGYTCGDKSSVGAWSNDAARLVVFCPALLESGPADDSVWSAEEAARKIQEGELFNKWRLVLAVAWLHEMGHYAMSFDDEDMVDAMGNDFTPLFAGNPGMFGEDPDSHRKVYGWLKAMNLAQTRQNRATRSPENYSAFTAAVYWKDWYWGSGSAKPDAEDEMFDPSEAYRVARGLSSGESTLRPPSPAA